MAGPRSERRGRDRNPTRGETAALEVTGTRASTVIWLALAGLWALRLALAFVPNMWAWGLNLQRFLDPRWAWTTWTLGALALLPPLARRIEPAFAWAGDRIARRTLGALAFAALAAALVWSAPDQLRYVGDFLLRQGAVRESVAPGKVFPQALPLDVLLHVTIPSALLSSVSLDPDAATRAIGAIDAALLALLAVAFARALELRGAAALASASIVLFGGYLGMFTGYSKAFSEMVVLVVALGVNVLGAARSERRWIVLGIVLALTLSLHRSALALLPTAAWVWTLRLKRDGPAALKRPAFVASIVLPIATITLMMPRMLAAARAIDVQHFAPLEVRRLGALAAAFAGARWADLLDVVALLSPLSLVIPFVLALSGRSRPRIPVVLAAGALPWLLLLVMMHPKQGVFRDWDVFAAGAGAFSMLAAAAVGETLRRAPAPGLATAVVFAVALPAAQWIFHATDEKRGFQRVEAYLTEHPARTGVERGTSWDYLGVAHFNRDQWGASADAFAHAAETSPSPRIIQQWAMAETMREDLRKAQALYHRLLEMDPKNPSAWLGLSAVTSRIPDPEDSRHAAEQLLKLEPGSAEARQILDYVNRQVPLAAPTARGAAAESSRAR